MRVRIPPRAPIRASITGSVPAEWSATSPENWDGYLIGRGFDSSTLRQQGTAQTVRLPCLPAKQCVPTLGIRIMPEAVRHAPWFSRRSSAVVAQGAEQRAGIAPIAVRTRATAPVHGEVSPAGRRKPAVTRLLSGALFDSAFPHQPMEDVMTRREDEVTSVTMSKRRHGFQLGNAGKAGRSRRPWRQGDGREARPQRSMSLRVGTPVSRRAA